MKIYISPTATIQIVSLSQINKETTFINDYQGDSH